MRSTPIERCASAHESVRVQVSRDNRRRLLRVRCISVLGCLPIIICLLSNSRYVFVHRFCIKMPWLHRLACFRDDVVFLIFLYQRWIYRVDYQRVNEVHFSSTFSITITRGVPRSDFALLTPFPVRHSLAKWLWKAKVSPRRRTGRARRTSEWVLALVMDLLGLLYACLRVLSCRLYEHTVGRCVVARRAQARCVHLLPLAVRDLAPALDLSTGHIYIYGCTDVSGRIRLVIMNGVCIWQLVHAIERTTLRSRILAFDFDEQS
jgi:hypothetical protein